MSPEARIGWTPSWAQNGAVGAVTFWAVALGVLFGLGAAASALPPVPGSLPPGSPVLPGGGAGPGAPPGPGPGTPPAVPPPMPPGTTPAGPPVLPVPPPPGVPPVGAAPPAVPQVCANGPALTAAEVAGIVRAAAAAVDDDRTAIVVTDRLGQPLAVHRKPAALPGIAEVALGLARSAAFFSNDTAPLSSRTVRFVSGIHFPPAVARTPNAALYGIENTNRGCDLNVVFHPGKAVPPARSLAGLAGGLRCDSFDASGCSAGPVTGKGDPRQRSFAEQRQVDPGGVPIFRAPLGPLVGGIGVAGIPGPAAEFAAFSGAFQGAFGLDPAQLPKPGVVFIDGIRLPFVNTLRPPPGVVPGVPSAAVAASHGACAPSGWLAGPFASPELSTPEVQRIVGQAVDAARRTRAFIRLPAGARTRMVIAVGDLQGNVLGLFRMADAPIFSVDVAVAKARNVVYFSRDKTDLPGVPAATAVTNRTLSFGAQPLYPPGIAPPDGPFFPLFQGDSARPCSQGSEPRNANQNGVVFFPGSIPLYRGTQLIGGLGISGDGVEQDDYVSFLGAEGFLPPESLWADQVKLGGVRLPFLKFPRNPER